MGHIQTARMCLNPGVLTNLVLKNCYLVEPKIQQKAKNMEYILSFEHIDEDMD